jgi:dissimilatory sulfite reductase (desulfoviridin) alpha/beta subunit
VEQAAPRTGQPWQIDRCRAEDGCPNSLVGLRPLAEQIEAVIRDSAWVQRLATIETGRRRHPHHQLRVALAACPNACTQPQVRDIGLIASRRPARIKDDCTGCGLCAAACREKAIVVEGTTARLDDVRCLGCGRCGGSCPNGTLEMGDLRFRLMVGGRLGRHPRLATEWPITLSASEVSEAVRRLLVELADHAEADESLSAAAARLEDWPPTSSKPQRP